MKIDLDKDSRGVVLPCISFAAFCSKFVRLSYFFILTGVDLAPGMKCGTWLGLSKTGRLAALLDVYIDHKQNMKGRGKFQFDTLQYNTVTFLKS